MGALEIALIVLVVVWTLIFVVFGIALIFILRGVKKSLDKINTILDDAHDFTHTVSKAGTPLRILGAVVSKFMDRGSKRNH